MGDIQADRAEAQLRAGVYARLSETYDAAESVPTQIERGAGHARRRGWIVAATFKDDGFSGFREITRDGFGELIAAIEAGQVDVVIVRDIDRLTRNLTDWNAFEKACVRHGVRLSAYTGGDLDLSTAEGAYYGGMETLRARRESAVKSARVREAQDREARKGRRVGGGQRWFGYTRIYANPDEPNHKKRRGDVGSDPGAGGGFPAVPGPVAGDVEQVVIEGGAGAPVPGDGALAGGGGRGALERGAGRGALVPPGVVELGDGVAQLEADGAGVAADDLPDGRLADAQRAGDAGRAVAHHVQGPQPQPAPAGVDAAARDGLAGHGQHRGGGAAPGPAAATGQVRDGGPVQARRVRDGAVGTAVLAQPADVSTGRARAAGRVRPAGLARDGSGRGVDAHLQVTASAW
jgi:DNA invertase Pin-like site-specific DNA recombinase